MPKKWTRNQKLLLLGIISTVIVGFLGKIQIDINLIQRDINELRLKTATIESLYADDAEFGALKTTCPEGKMPNPTVSPNGFEIICR